MYQGCPDIANKGVDIAPPLCKGFDHMERGNPLPMVRGLGVSTPTPLSEYICDEKVTRWMIE